MPARRRRHLAVLAAPLASVLLVSGCSLFQLDDGVQVDASQATLTEAANRTMEAQTGTYRAIYTYTVDPADSPAAGAIDGIETQVEGRYDRESGLRWAELDPDSESGVGSGEVADLEVVTDPEAGVAHTLLERDTPWQPLPFAEVPPTPGGLRHGTADVLAFLAVAAGGEGEVTSGGQSEINGVDTALLRVEKPLGAGVRGDEDLAALQAVVGVAELGPLLELPATFEIYVDGQRVVQRVVATIDVLPAMAAAGIQAESATVRVQLDLFELGAAPPVTLPDAEGEDAPAG
jgi:hypothetical protein